MQLSSALDARGVVCVVGAGGKKSTLYRLAGELDRAVVTATVRIPIFDDEVSRVLVEPDPVQAAASLRENARWPIGVVSEREREDRYLGYDTGAIATLADSPAGAVLVKADGARMRLFKAPDDREPQLPESAELVVPVASVRAVGQPLTEEAVHRPERVSAITGLEIGDRIGAEDVARTLASDRGGTKDVPEGARVVPIVNMVDDSTLERTAREVANEVLSGSAIDRVVLTRLIDEDPVIAVVER
ncbi:selenium cofactor biosynthesis protein YqeC [Natronorarus salvus]|uniref:selenium cofactor biosynthesis protein YqeC n=1 Tax=Natronorarus salvus TaxID=3117733 RepID=UPI002F26397B